MMFCKDNQADQRHCFKVLKCDKFFSQIFFWGEKDKTYFLVPRDLQGSTKKLS